MRSSSNLERDRQYSTAPRCTPAHHQLHVLLWRWPCALLPGEFLFSPVHVFGPPCVSLLHLLVGMQGPWSELRTTLLNFWVRPKVCAWMCSQPWFDFLLPCAQVHTYMPDALPLSAIYTPDAPKPEDVAVLLAGDEEVDVETLRAKGEWSRAAVAEGCCWGWALHRRSPLCGFCLELGNCGKGAVGVVVALTWDFLPCWPDILMTCSYCLHAGWCAVYEAGGCIDDRGLLKSFK